MRAHAAAITSKFGSTAGRQAFCGDAFLAEAGRIGGHPPARACPCVDAAGRGCHASAGGRDCSQLFWRPGDREWRPALDGDPSGPKLFLSTATDTRLLVPDADLSEVHVDDGWVLVAARSGVRVGRIGQGLGTVQGLRRCPPIRGYQEEGAPLVALASGRLHTVVSRCSSVGQASPNSCGANGARQPAVSRVARPIRAAAAPERTDSWSRPAERPTTG